MKYSVFFLMLSFFIYNCKKKLVNEKGFIIQLIQDEVKKEDYYFNNSNQIIKINQYFPSGKLENAIYFDYDGEQLNEVFLDSIEKSKDDWLLNYYLNAEMHSKYLKKEGVYIGNQFLFTNEISDFNKLLINVSNLEHITENKLDIYIAKNLKLNIRFYPSSIERFIPQNSKVTYFEYALNKKKELAYEKIIFDDGILKINYRYNSERIEEIIYSLKYNNGESLKSIKKYVLLK